MNILEFCDVCFRIKNPDIVEVFKGKFAFLKTLPIEQYRFVKQVVESRNGRMMSIGGNAGFKIHKNHRQFMINLLQEMGLTLHTLEEHLYNLARFLQVTPKKIGKSTFVNLPEDGDWKFLDTETRIWVQLKPFDVDGKKGVPVRMGSILCCEKHETSKYYLVSSNSSNLFNVEKRAAYNLAIRYFKERKSFWVNHHNLELGIIPLVSLRNMPDEIFYSLVRYRPMQKHIPGLLIFDKEDFQIISNFLKIINLKLIQCSKLVELRGDSGMMRGSPVLSLADIGDKKISLEKFFEKIGAEVQETPDALEIKMGEDFFRISIVEREKLTMDHKDQTWYLSSKVIENVWNFEEFATTVLHKYMILGSPQEILSECWIVSNETDESYIINCIIEHVENHQLVKRIISDPQKKKIIEDWYKNNVENIDQAPISILRELHQIFNQ